MLEFSILIQAAIDVDGQWTAHCLNWDLVTQGTSPKHAIEMAAEAIILAIADDLEAGLDPADRPSAERKAWDRFSSIQHGGMRVAAADVDKLLSRASAIAAVLYLSQVTVRGSTSLAASVTDGLPDTPPPFMIAELRNHDRAAHY